MPTNLILYGPPGTGKTFATMRRAVALIDGDQWLAEDLDTLRMRYRELVTNRQIEFVTFHQSYAYEDFVEGLRPTLGDDEESDGDEAVHSAGFTLRPVDGTFRRICRRAELPRTASQHPARAASPAFIVGDRRVFKMSIGRAGSQDEMFYDAIAHDYIAIGFGGELNWSDPKYLEKENVFEKWKETDPKATRAVGDVSQTWQFRALEKDDMVLVSRGNSAIRAIGVVTGDYRFEDGAEVGYPHRRAVEWLVVPAEDIPSDELYGTSLMQRTCYRLNDSKLNREALQRIIDEARPTDRTGLSVTATPNQFVLIIDEINRANISKVFGELITLLEPDKRLGQPNAITVTLPYSRDQFGIPDNLHIIGTMNTSDRSIALLDTALRRRFDFEELMPRSDLLAPSVDEVPLRNLLARINEQIEYLFDREHQIGHAFFLGCETREQIDAVMRRKVIPLLAEYFFEDWSRVALVLGDVRGEHFLHRIVLASPPGMDEADDERIRWTVRDPFAEDAYDGFR
ncbi:AAA family ATPase [Acuticoccus sediminis]|uniref:AAA family ATPase n=1 Tax=Acuticoccus sediminis TaxID=2184697 RepID=A0A8B2NL47_9HYPH|nr:AAA family ATPase [Acuticoccus sediminis]RAH95650.1 AAA family ATPase [Acuticoccus sediminis]